MHEIGVDSDACMTVRIFAVYMFAVYTIFHIEIGDVT